MLKKSLLILAAAVSVAGSTKAQNRCATDEMMQKAREAHPEIIQLEAQMEAQIKEGLKHIDLSKFAAKGTSDSLPQPGVILPIPPISPRDVNRYIYHIPIVIHVIHDYGAEYLKDDDIFNAVKEWNDIYMERNADTADVIAPFRYKDSVHDGYIGNPRIVLHLANKDPHGNPTKGILHHQSYLSVNGGDEAKYDGWPNGSYINIWFVKAMPSHSNAAAYAYYPSAVQAPAMAPFDGVISLYNYITTDKTINHEIGHVLNLRHVWGDANANMPNIACGDDDVDDTPPTKGHDGGGCTPTPLYDTNCSNGYVKNYLIDSFVIVQGPNGPDTTATFPNAKLVTIDYPDTNNSQNIMDYTFCAKNFTKGQVLRMHQALNLDVANRSHLWSKQNLVATGIISDASMNPDSSSIPMIDMPPIPDFSVEKGKTASVPTTEREFFYCANDNAVKFSFINRSWNDTITQVRWRFSNGATTPDTTVSGVGLTSAISNTFTQPGWVTVTMDVTGNGAGGTTTSSRQAVYAADGDNPIVVNPQVAQYVMDFNPGQTDAWPMFNYYNNEFKWQLNNTTGYLDNTCIEYTGFDSRVFPANELGTPAGDYDDFFTPAFNLTAMANDTCNLNFMSAGTFRTGSPADMKDSLYISYSIDCGRSWVPLQGIGKHDLANNGTLVQGYAPLWWGEWALHSIKIPTVARTNKTFFRFRYKPGVDANLTSTGNNFYLDRINIGNFPLGVNTLVNNEHNIALAPNPTTGSSYVIINGINSGTANVQVTDVTGRVVYNTAQKLVNNLERIEIPASALQVKGMYMVHVKTDTQNYTEKLVAY